MSSLWNAFTDQVGLLVGSVTANIASRILTYSICQMRPELSDPQRVLLRSHFETAIHAFCNGDINISRQIRGLLAIVFHELTDEEQEMLWQQLVAILHAFDLHGVIEEEPPIVTYDDLQQETPDADATLTALVMDYKCNVEMAQAIPPCVRTALVAELARSPPCSITLEDIVDSNGRVTTDVVALVQQVAAGQTKFHVFLYKKAALEQWFAVGGNVNPLTRERVHRSSQLFPLT